MTNFFATEEVKFCNYESLHVASSHIKTTKVPLRLTAKEIYIPSRVFKDSMVQKWEVRLNKKIRLTHRFPTLTTKLATMDTELDSLYFFGSKFCIQELIKDSLTINPEIRKAFSFRQKGEKYMVLEGAYADDRERSNLHWVLVFRITASTAATHIYSAFSNSVLADSGSYIGDFDRDGLVDFCFLRKDALQLFHIDQDRFTEMGNGVLPLTQKDGNYYLDLGRAKWPYPLRESDWGCRKKTGRTPMYRFPD